MKNMPSKVIDIGTADEMSQKILSERALLKIFDETDMSQLTTVTIEPGEDAGKKQSHAGDQLMYIIQGSAVVALENQELPMRPGQALLIPAGAMHHVRNAGDDTVHFLSIYTPPVW